MGRINSSTLTGTAAVLFVAGIVALLASLFRAADKGGGWLLWVAVVLLAATIVCWFAATRAQGQRG